MKRLIIAAILSNMLYILQLSAMLEQEKIQNQRYLENRITESTRKFLRCAEKAKEYSDIVDDVRRVVECCSPLDLQHVEYLESRAQAAGVGIWMISSLKKDLDKKESMALSLRRSFKGLYREVFRDIVREEAKNVFKEFIGDELARASMIAKEQKKRKKLELSQERSTAVLYGKLSAIWKIAQRNGGVLDFDTMMSMWLDPIVRSVFSES